MNHAPGSTISPFATWLVPAGFDDLFPRTENDANGNRDSSGYTVGTGGTLTASPNATYTYDASGHLTAKTDTSTGKVTTFAYDHRDRLTGITRKTSGGTVDYRTTYVYDALNRRIAEQVDADGAGAGSPVTTWTVFDGQNPYADFDGAGSLAQRYLHGAAVDALLARSDASGVTDWYLTDRLGSVRDIVDTSGTVLYHTGYDSFGNKVSTTGSGGDRFGFTGREHDAALNLYYYRARFYDPATGRFVSKDPLGYDAGDANLYRYVGNGPTNGTDPSGMEKRRTQPRGMSSKYDGPGRYRNPTYRNYPYPDPNLDHPGFIGDQIPFPSIPNFPSNPKDVIVFIGPPHDPRSRPNDTYRYKQDILESLKVSPENIYYFDSINSLIAASKAAIERNRGRSNPPSLYFWGHAGDGHFMFEAGVHTNEQKEENMKKGMEAITNTILGLNPSQVTILACNLAGLPGSVNTKGEGVINQLSQETGTSISSIKGFEAPFLTNSQYLWYLQRGGSIYYSIPSR